MKNKIIYFLGAIWVVFYFSMFYESIQKDIKNYYEGLFPKCPLNYYTKLVYDKKIKSLIVKKYKARMKHNEPYLDLQNGKEKIIIALRSVEADADVETEYGTIWNDAEIGDSILKEANFYALELRKKNGITKIYKYKCKDKEFD